MAMVALLQAAFLFWQLPGLSAESAVCEKATAALAAEEPGYTHLVQLQKKALARGGASEEDQSSKSASAHGIASERSAGGVVGNISREESAGGAAGNGTKEDSLTVMLLNTYLLEFSVLGLPIVSAPNGVERSKGIAYWFNTLSPEEVPDVLVFNEILNTDGENLVRSICTDSFSVSRPICPSEYKKIMPCRRNSHFAFTTAVDSPTLAGNPILAGGVVVLVKKGLQITFAHDEKFNDLAGTQLLGNKGFWATVVYKGKQKYWVVGTHLQPDAQYEDIRVKQWAQIRSYVDAAATPGDRLVYAGDMNILTKAQVIPANGKVITPAMLETNAMLQGLGDINAPASGGELVKRGFWLPLSKPLDVSWDMYNNNFIAFRPADEQEGSHMYDWVLAPGKGDRFARPKALTRQVVPVLADRCFASEAKEGTTTDDLSDHYGIFATLCYQDACAPVGPIAGHRGSSGQVPRSGPTC